MVNIFIILAIAFIIVFIIILIIILNSKLFRHKEKYIVSLNRVQSYLLKIKSNLHDVKLYINYLKIKSKDMFEGENIDFKIIENIYIIKQRLLETKRYMRWIEPHYNEFKKRFIEKENEMKREQLRKHKINTDNKTNISNEEIINDYSKIINTYKTLDIKIQKFKDELVVTKDTIRSELISRFTECDDLTLLCFSRMFDYIQNSLNELSNKVIKNDVEFRVLTEKNYEFKILDLDDLYAHLYYINILLSYMLITKKIVHNTEQKINNNKIQSQEINKRKYNLQMEREIEENNWKKFNDDTPVKNISINNNENQIYGQETNNDYTNMLLKSMKELNIDSLQSQCNDLKISINRLKNYEM